MPIGWLSVPRDWIATFGVIAKFAARVVAEVFTGKVFRFFGEALRQCGVLILGSTMVIWGLAFILGLQCGIEGAYFNRSVGAPAYAGVFIGMVRPTRDHALRVRLHDERQGGHGPRGRARLDADHRRDRRPRG